MQMNGSVWKSQYWSFNPCITSVMHLFCDAHSAASNEKFKMTTPATDALLRPRLEADAARRGVLWDRLPPARWRDCTMHTSREWHQWSLRWHSIAAKCIGDFLCRFWTSDSPEKRSIELRAEFRWVRRPPKRTRRPLRSACLRTGISQLRDRLPHRMRRCAILLKPSILSVLPVCLLSYDMS